MFVPRSRLFRARGTPLGVVDLSNPLACSPLHPPCSGGGARCCQLAPAEGKVGAARGGAEPSA
eukprot:9615016-Alexandrium_andersonii.AAC.1